MPGGPGDALFDLASLRLGYEEHLGDVIAGEGTDVGLDVIRAWWSLRSPKLTCQASGRRDYLP